MDRAVAVIEAYLRINGYLTVAEYPVLEEGHRGPAQSVTDLDILAVRFSVPSSACGRTACRARSDAGR